MADSGPETARSSGRDPAAWRAWVVSRRERPPVPFDEHWTRFQAEAAACGAGDAPPAVWWPSPAAVERTNLHRLIEARGLGSYEELHAWSVADRAGFWEEMARRLPVVWKRPPRAPVDLDAGPTAARWFPGAELNCVDSLFAGDPGRTAIVAADESGQGARSVSYGELRRLAGRVARGLREQGFEPGDAIALYLPMTVECVAAYLGILHAGCAVVSIADSFSADELARRLEIADARAVVTVDAYRRAGRSVDLLAKVRKAKAPRTVVIPAEGGAPALRAGELLWEELLAGDGSGPTHAGSAETIVNILFSSGTTGTPKAIPWSHVTSIKCAADGHLHHDIQPGDVVAWPTNIGWMMGPWLIFATLWNGATMALFEGAPGGRPFVEFVRDAGVTILGVVPSLVRAWRTASAVAFDEWPRVRVLSSTGEPSDRESYLWLMSRTGYRAPVIEYMGGTEIAGGYLTGTLLQPCSPATFTTPALGLDFVLLDEAGKAVERGVPGTAFLVPPSVGLSDRLLNADHERQYHAGCPRGPNGEELRRHGDRVVALPGGFYRAAGRADDTMNLGGIKVGSQEIEEVLSGHPAIAECAAVGVQKGGEGVEHLVVFAVLTDPSDPQALRAELAQRLALHLNPLFKLHDLVVVPELPRTASNKLLRRALRARYTFGP